MASLKLTLVKSTAKRLPNHKLCIQGLGLRKRLNGSVVVQDTPAIMGMINKVRYLLKVETV
jgi:large subunit ribosomal protein L30